MGNNGPSSIVWRVAANTAPLDETELTESLTRHGLNPSSSYLSFLREHCDKYTHATVGVMGLGVKSVYSPRETLETLKYRFFGDNFYVFMGTPIGFMAFDLRVSANNPPVVFLDNDSEPDEIGGPLGDVTHVADDFDTFLSGLDTWAKPERFAQTTMTNPEPIFERLGVEPPIHPIHKESPLRLGDILRSGLLGDQRLEIPHLITHGSHDAATEPDLACLNFANSYAAVSAMSSSTRLIPVMIGRDGWLALDYRETDSEPPVVVVHRAEVHPNGKVTEIANSLTEAFDLYLPGPISGSIHRLEGLSLTD